MTAAASCSTRSFGFCGTRGRPWCSSKTFRTSSLTTGATQLAPSWTSCAVPGEQGCYYANANFLMTSMVVQPAVLSLSLSLFLSLLVLATFHHQVHHRLWLAPYSSVSRYLITFRVINSGTLLPQHRQRIYLVGFREDLRSSFDAFRSNSQQLHFTSSQKKRKCVDKGYKSTSGCRSEGRRGHCVSCQSSSTRCFDRNVSHQVAGYAPA